MRISNFVYPESINWDTFYKAYEYVESWKNSISSHESWLHKFGEDLNDLYLQGCKTRRLSRFSAAEAVCDVLDLDMETMVRTIRVIDECQKRNCWDYDHVEVYCMLLRAKRTISSSHN